MLFKNIAYTDENFDVVEGGYVGVKGDRITYVGTTPPTEDFGGIYNGRGKLLIPAFVNAHSHLPMSILRGYGEGLPLMEWLTTRIWPFEAAMTADDIFWGCRLGIIEMLRYGIASTSEMYIMQEPLVRAFAGTGAKTNVSMSTVWMEKGAFCDTPGYADIMNCVKNHHMADDGRIQIELCPHAEYTTTETIVRSIAEAAQEHGLGIQIHVSETKGEVDMCRTRHQGRSPIKYLHDCGLFDSPTTAAHCVWADDEDIAILAEDKVTVATNPKSNMKLASGIAPALDYLNAGVNVAIGTDSVASNNNLNMLEEIRFFNYAQRVRYYDPTCISTKQTLYAATRAGAIAQRREDCGLIKEGFKADITVLNIDTPTLRPRYDYLNNLIYSASGSDVVLTMADGKVLYRDGDFPTLDVEEIVFEVERARTRILGEKSEINIPDLLEL